jgi:hypothetical protein
MIMIAVAKERAKRPDRSLNSKHCRKIKPIPNLFLKASNKGISAQRMKFNLDMYLITEGKALFQVISFKMFLSFDFIDIAASIYSSFIQEAASRNLKDMSI